VVDPSKESLFRLMPFRLANLFNRSINPKEIIIVSGLPRSGTSMMMKMLAAAGMEVLTDNLRSSDENNPKGYYEFERVKKLKEGDFDWLAQAQGKVVKVISPLLEFLPNQYLYKIIFMHRDMDEVLSSQRQMLVRGGVADDQVPDRKLAELYGNHLTKMETWLDQQPNMTVLYMSYNEILRDPEPNLSQIVQFLGGNIDPKVMALVVDQTLYRERRSG
jgi:hypothetical protein